MLVLFELVSRATVASLVVEGELRGWSIPGLKHNSMEDPPYMWALVHFKSMLWVKCPPTGVLEKVVVSWISFPLSDSGSKLGDPSQNTFTML
ncbi:hypothetical protein AVEN_107398-1 [Araneus ventricosus]|uniref:Uncharacterized protein n=1 Tax=Araneus ventricosus TaxID=182803 RepID=A0A4Y2X2G5_ARAVE|nr:hypothetical protein AVEN_107398-1 [Araneus ventricosus]